jgi:hypothetical protein
MKLIKLPKFLYFDYLEIAEENNRPFPKVIKENKKNIFIEKVYNDCLKSLYYEAWYWSKSNYGFSKEDSEYKRYISARYTLKAINKHFENLTKIEDWNTY